MNRTRVIADNADKGHKRYRIYQSVIDRYLKAKEQGFYLEAITLMESIITDRLESALIYRGELSQDKAFITLDRCLNKLKGKGIISEALFERIEIWKDERNHALHEMAKIEEGDESSFEQRYSEQERVANDGYEIFKSLKKERKR